MNIPEELRSKLHAAGKKQLEIGNLTLHLVSGKMTRTIRIDGEVVAEPEFQTPDIDWKIVEEAIP